MHTEVRSGTKLRIVSTSLYIHGRVRSARCEVRPSNVRLLKQRVLLKGYSKLWDGDKLCVSGIHSTVNGRQTKEGMSKM